MQHTVQPGDELRKIAKRFGVTLQQLLAANPQIENPDAIRVGQVIEIPGQGGASSGGGGAAPDDGPGDASSGGSAAPDDGPDQFTGTYIVRSGDSLSKIATHVGVSVSALIANNPQITNPNVIQVGQVIRIPAARTGTVTAPPAVEGLPPWAAVAKREMDTGVDEISGSNDNPRIVEYHQTTTLRATDDETPWCSSFVNFCIIQAGLGGTNNAMARSWLQWGQKLELDSPRRGCVTVFSRPPGPTQGHVGFYWGDAGDRILVLGGNQGNQVSIAGFTKSTLLGLRWPEGV